MEHPTTEPNEPNSTEIFIDLLKRAAQAHGLYEKQTGKPDPDWPEWYAEHMTHALHEAGYRITRASEE